MIPEHAKVFFSLFFRRVEVERDPERPGAVRDGARVDREALRRAHLHPEVVRLRRRVGLRSTGILHVSRGV